MYNKLFTKILDSSLWLEPAHVRLVWITMLAMQDQDGMVALSSIGNVAARARVSEEEAADAIRCLQSPDERNPGQEHAGKRIERIPGTGWLVLNAEKYRAIVTSEESRRLNRERVARCRAKKAGNAECNDSVMQSVAVAEKKQPCLFDSKKEKKATTAKAAAAESEQQFECFWDMYPLKVNKKHALKMFQDALKKVPLQRIMDGLEQYKRFLKAQGSRAPSTAHAGSWLNAERWNDEFEAPRRRQPDGPQAPTKEQLDLLEKYPENKGVPY